MGKLKEKLAKPRCQKKRSNFLKVCQIWELEPEKLTTESPEVGKKLPINIQQLEENPI